MRLAILTAIVLTAPLGGQKLGTITFPNSGGAAIQTSFLEGVKDLHSFAFDEAAEAFQKVQHLDPNFALGYWGEAMSYNHPLWAQVDVPAAKKVLERLAPTPETRVAKASTAKEKALIGAENLLFYAPGDKLARDIAYSKAMEQMYARWPEDDEVSILYALSVLGTVRPVDKGYRRQALAGSIAMRIFEKNPDHPGAAHFIIHAFDDPDHAILALPAARVYAKIAPAAPHALHMPAHIFVQLGMWRDVEDSNIAAYKAAEDVIARMHLPEGREDFHTLSWLTYADLMQGKFDDAKKNVELARQTSARNAGNRGIEDGYKGMLARYILETGQWQTTIPGGSAQARFIAGFSAAKRTDLSEAGKALSDLRAIREKTSDAYAAKQPAIMEKEVAAAMELARGQKPEAEKLAKEAADIEVTLAAPSGPPEPIKPALELYAEILLDEGKPVEAAAAFEQALLRTPNRTPSVTGLANATFMKSQRTAPSGQ